MLGLETCLGLETHLTGLGLGLGLESRGLGLGLGTFRSRIFQDHLFIYTHQPYIIN